MDVVTVELERERWPIQPACALPSAVRACVAADDSAPLILWLGLSGAFSKVRVKR